MAASDGLKIHIPPDSNPANIRQLITVLSETPETVFESGKEMSEYLEERGVGGRSEIRTTAKEMGIITETHDGLQITPLGLALARVRDDARGDLLHLLLYGGWHEADPKRFLQSWAYRHCCNRYWAEEVIELNSAYIERQVAETVDEAANAFASEGDFQASSFGRKSLNGAHNWLRGLNPAVLEKAGGVETFRRRAFCPPELLLLALGWMLRDEQSVTEVDVLLSRDKREALCRVCLLAPESLDRALDWMMPIFPEVIEPGTKAGFYGRFVRLHKRPTMEDVIR